ncbi:hypothetical protein ACWEOO_09345 [Kribbella sp. NPDC004138]
MTAERDHGEPGGQDTAHREARRPQPVRPQERLPDQHGERDEHDQQRAGEHALGHVIAEPVVDYPLQALVEVPLAGAPVGDEPAAEGTDQVSFAPEVGGRRIAREHAWSNDEGDDERDCENGEPLHGHKLGESARREP